MASKDKSLAISIIVAAVLITGGLVFFGLQMNNSNSGENLQEEITKGIEAYIQDQQAKYEEQQEANKPIRPSSINASELVDDDAVLGQADAPLTIIEFSDYECPFCKRYFTDTYPLIKKNYIDTGKAKLVFRDLPLSIHGELAVKEAMAAECVREQSDDATYFEYHDLIFTNTSSNGAGLEDEQLSEFATQVGVNITQFESCLSSEKFADEVNSDIDDARNATLSGTPAFVIGDTIISGALDYADFEQVIEMELQKLDDSVANEN